MGIDPLFMFRRLNNTLQVVITLFGVLPRWVFFMVAKGKYCEEDEEAPAWEIILLLEGVAMKISILRVCFSGHSILLAWADI